MSQSRQLAAIMFTDIVGYTALMEEDEEKAFELLKKNRRVQRPIIEKYNGKWLKEIELDDGYSPIAEIYSLLGMSEEAAFWLEKAYENGELNPEGLNYERLFEIRQLDILDDS